MDRDQATEINKHLLAAAAGLDRATKAIFKLGKDEREAYTEVLFDVQDALHFGLLRALYAEHPELKPPEDKPRISSTLRWEEVSLPDPISEADIDAAIFEVLTPKLQKVAMVIGSAFQRCEGFPVPDQHRDAGRAYRGAGGSRPHRGRGRPAHVAPQRGAAAALRHRLIRSPRRRAAETIPAP